MLLNTLMSIFYYDKKMTLKSSNTWQAMRALPVQGLGYSVLYSTLYSVQCMYITVYSTVSVQPLVQCTVVYSTVYSTVYSSVQYNATTRVRNSELVRFRTYALE